MANLDQQIYSTYLLHPASHMTTTANLANIVKMGILPYNSMSTGTYKNISNEDVQKGRASITVPCSGRTLHDYVPLYFGLKTPMVAVNQSINDELIFLRVSLEILARNGVVFTDGNARSSSTKFYQFSNIATLQCLDVKAIHSVKYAKDQELKRKKQAEILVPDKIDWTDILDIFVNGSSTKQHVLAILGQNAKKVEVAPGWYFK